jgi:hypothetical protein
MIKVKNFIISLFVVCNIFSSVLAQIQRLSDYPFNSASVLPVCYHQGKKYAILSQEAFGSAQGTYDDFGGSRDAGENHPLITAARECHEEAIIVLTLGLTLEEFQRYIDIAKTNNTVFIIAYAKNVTYIVYFDRYKKPLLNNFYRALKKTTDFHSREKNRIALVRWKLLKKTVANAKRASNIQIEALELDPITLLFQKKNVTLRPFFIKKMQPFCMDKPYQQGRNKKIRFYD